MKANFTKRFIRLPELIVFTMVMVFSGIVHAQTPTPPVPFKGGSTYWVDGIGADSVLPKDTFVNLTGLHDSGNVFIQSTGLLTALNNQGVDPATLGQITILLAYNGVEPGLMNVGRTTGTGGIPFISAQRPIVMKPAAGFNINMTTTATASLVANASLLRFNGAQYFTIDGEGTPGQRNLTFTIPSAVTAAVRVIDIRTFSGGGNRFVTVKNCRVVGSSTASTAPGGAQIYTYAGIYSGGITGSPSVPLFTSQNITISNNLIEAVQNGIYMRGVETIANRQDNALIVSNNIIGGTIVPFGGETQPTTYVGAAGAAGITIIGQKNAVVSGNTIRNNIPSGGGFRGIQLASTNALAMDSNINVTGNKIYNLRSVGVNGVYGIRISNSVSHAQPLAININNNTVGDLLAAQTNGGLTGTNNIVGVMLEDNSSNAGVNVYHNSVHIYGDTLATSAVSACFLTSSGVTGGVRVANNIFANRLGRTLTTAGLASTSYIYVVGAAVNPFSMIANNAYFCNNTTGTFSYIGNLGASNKATLKTWAAVTNDNSSITTLPPFVGTSNDLCVISNGAATTIGNYGTSVGITTDINGVTRSNTTPSLGAYEFTGNSTNAYYSLKGGSQYMIGGASNWPQGQTGTGSFSSLADAFTYLNTYGVGGNGTVNLRFANNYTGETTFIPQLLNYTGASASRNLLIDVTPGVSVTVSAPAITNVPTQYALLNMVGAKFVTINGSSAAGQRNLTFAMPSTFTSTTIHVVGLETIETDSITDISISNCNIVGASSNTVIYTASGIYHGGYNATAGFISANISGSKNLTISNNYISAVKNGIYLRGANVFNGQTRNVTIYRNLVGGTTSQGMGAPVTYIGGTANSAGIMLKGIAGALVDSNIVRNCDSVGSGSLGFRGIDLDLAGEAANAVDSAIIISRNTIYNLTTATGSYCVGIRINLGASTNRALKVINNSVSKIRGIGQQAAGANANPTGILIDGSGTVNNLDLDMFHNTVNMNGNTLTSNFSSAAVFFAGSIQGGVRLQNNILNNRMGRTSAVAGNIYALFTATSTGATAPFNIASGGLVNANTYGADGANNANNYLVGALSTNYAFVKQWQAYVLQDLNSIGFNAFFLNDSTPMLDPRFAGVPYNGSVTMLAVPRDITGALRPAQFTCTGALQFVQDYLPLAGNSTYLINGINNLPRTSGSGPFSFATIADAVNYLNTNGVDGLSADVRKVTLRLDLGYVGESQDTFIPAIRAYPRANPFRIVSLTTAPGRSDTIRTSTTQLYPANGSVLRFIGVSNFEIDGDNGSGGRGITIALPSVANPNASTLKLVDITPGDNPVSNIQIRNCNLIGVSTSNTISTYAAIYMGGIAATPAPPAIGSNVNHVFENNFIAAVRYGIYAQGLATPFGQQDKGMTIKRNIIGSSATYAGNTLNWGGVASASGIFLSSQANVLVDSNVISNNLNLFANNRGIELFSANQAAIAVDSGITISRNTITAISNATATGGAYGILLSFNDSITPKSDRGLVIKNNMISDITAPGTTPSPATAYSFLNPIGIYVESAVLAGGKGNIDAFGLRIWNNSVNLGYGTTLNVTGGASACIAFNPQIRGGVTMQNNIFQNRSGRASGTGAAASVLMGHTGSPFTVSNNNIYYTNAPGATNILAASSATVAAPIVYNTIGDIMAFTKQDTMSLNFITNFTSETNLTLAGISHNAGLWGSRITSVTNDLEGQPRNPANRPTIGADELSLSLPVDSIAPRIYDITKLPLFCISGSPIQVMFRVFERTTAVASDTLYYTVNNGPEQFIVGASITDGEFTRAYNIPAQPDNSSIAYRLAVRDNSAMSFRTVLPATGYNYTSTSFNTFPMTYGFDLPNTGGWLIDNNVNGVPSPGGWDFNSFGSVTPSVLPKTGLKAALFPAATLPDGSVSRMVSPCLDFTNMKVPTVRIWVSQDGGQLTKKDQVQVTVSGGFNIWSAPLGVVERPNSDLIFPEYTQLDVCLTNFAGLSGMRVGIEGLSKNGLNILLDSVVIFDDVLNQPVSPLTSTVCAYNPLTLGIPASSDVYRYAMVDTRTGFALGASVPGNANGSGLIITAPNPSNPAIARIDSVRAIIQYTNKLSGCVWQMPDTATIQIKNFFGGPFMTKGTPFDGVYGNGTFAKPDGSKLGDVLTYQIAAPSGLTNADYGSKWTVVGVNISTPIEGRPLADYTYTAATPSTSAYITARPSMPDLDSTFKVSATIRFLPSGCDSVVVRYVKVTSAPTVAFSSADSVCSGAAIYFTNETTALPNTYPITYLWTFGDGTTASTGDANKIYAFDKAPGMYTVTLKATNAAGVFSTTSKQVRVLPAPLTTYTSGLACGTDPIAFTNTTVDAVSYLWTVRLNNQLKDTSTQTSPTFSFAIPDTSYNVTLRATNTLGCYRDSVRPVFAFAKPVASFTTTNQCAGTYVNFVNNSTISSGGTNRVNTFGSFWDFGNGQIGLSNSPVYQYPGHGNYTVKLKVTSNYGCTDSTTRNVTIYESPNAAFTTGIACQNDVVTITNNTTYTGGANKVLYAWDFGDFSPISNDPNPVKTYGGLGNFTIQMVAHDTVHNCYDTATKKIEVNEVPFAVFAATNGCVNQPVSFSNGSIPPIGQTLTYAWTFGDGGTSIATNPTHAYATDGKFPVSMVATTNKGCSDASGDTVSIEKVPVATFTWDTLSLTTVAFVPNVLGLSNYRWDFGDSTKLNAGDDTVQNTYQVKGIHRVTLTVTSSNGCTGTHTEDSVWTYWTIGFEELFAAKFGLSVYPNPFNSVANIDYTLNSRQDVTVTVTDILGRKISEVVEKGQNAGNHSIQLDESKFGATSGVYMVRIQIGDEAVTKQLIRQ